MKADRKSKLEKMKKRWVSQIWVHACMAR